MPKLTTYYKGDMLFETRIGKHNLTMDVPPAVGGSDRAPTPPAVFIASLGSCIAAMVAYYCRQTSIDATDMTVDVIFEKADQPERLVNLKVQINLPHGDCTGKEEALLRVAEHCPVHETIMDLQGISFEIVSGTKTHSQRQPVP